MNKHQDKATPERLPEYSTMILFAGRPALKVRAQLERMPWGADAGITSVNSIPASEVPGAQE